MNENIEQQNLTDLIEPQFRLAIESLVEGFVILTPIFCDGNITDFISLYFNDAISKIIKTPKEQLVGKRLTEIFHDYSEINFFNLCCESLLTNTPKRINSLHIRKKIIDYEVDGYFDIAITSFQNMLVITVHDITEKLESEKKINEVTKQLQDIIDGSPNVIFAKDLQGKFIIVNRHAEKILGLSNKELKGKRNDYDFFPKEQADFFTRHDKEIIESGKPEQLEIDVALPGNNPFSILLNLFPLLNENNQPYGICGIATDISERKRTEQALLESEIKLLETQKLVHVGNFTYDIPTNSFEWTDETFNIHERDPKLGVPSVDEVLALIHPEDKERVVNTIKDGIGKKEIVRFEARLLLPGNKIKYINYIGRIIFDKQGNACKRVGAITDITERKLIELNLEKTLEDLERSNRELEQFAYVASHDLQEPLRMVSNYAKMLEIRYKNKLDDKADEYIHFIVDGAKRMNALIRDLLAFARIKTTDIPFVKLDLNKILADVLHDLQSEINEAGAEIIIDNLPEIAADPVQMEQLFQNLVQNAVKFTNHKKPVVQVSCVSNQNEWVFCVKDNGIGISPEYYSKIFMLFQRLCTQTKYPGTGIGLAMCKKIVERHEGRIWVESEAGKGSSFYFTIPVK